MEFLQTSAGLVTGTALLCTLWLVLQLLGRHGHNLGSKIARTLRHPVLIGLGITLYATWFTHLANRELTLASEKVLNRFSLTLLIGTISWAFLNVVGHAFISSGQMRRWLQMQDPKDQAMLINLLGRLYTILVLLFSENPGQMNNRRILANISLRYEDLGLDIQQSIFLENAAIVQRTGADFAFNYTTLYPAPDTNAAELPTLIRRKDQAA